MYREVFFVDEPVLMVPKLYVNLPTCLLRVVDNDSGEELTRVFQKVAPNNLKKNKVEETNYTEHAITENIFPHQENCLIVYLADHQRQKSEFNLY